MRKIPLTAIVIVFVLELPALIQAEAGVCDPDPEKWITLPGTGKFVHIETTRLSVNWSTGVLYCEKQGGRMLRVEDEATAKFLKVEVPNHFEKNSGFVIWHWLGLKSDPVHKFVYPDGKPMNPEDFMYPVRDVVDNGCVCISFELERMTTASCGLRRYVVCEDSDPCGPLPVFRFNKEITSYDGGVKYFSENQNVSVNCLASFEEGVAEMKINSSRIDAANPKVATGTFEMTIDSEDFYCTCTAVLNDTSTASVTVLVGFRVVPRIVGKNPSDIKYQAESGKSITLAFTVFSNKPDQLHISNITYKNGSKAYIKPEISVEEGDDNQHKVKLVFPNVNESSTYAVYLSNGAPKQLRLDFTIEKVHPDKSLLGHYGFYILVLGSFLIALLALTITWILACKEKAKMEPVLSEILPMEEQVVPNDVEEVVENVEEDGTAVDFPTNGDDVVNEGLTEKSEADGGEN